MKKLYKLQALILFAGTVFAWYTVYTDFVRFYDIYGTIFRIRDCVVPNPVLTPCFYGAFAFLGAFIWSIYIYRIGDKLRRRRQQKFLMLFLVAGTIFAWSNFGYEFIKFYFINKAVPTIGCSGQIVKNPFLTACFYGSVLFLVGLLMSIIIKIKNNR